MNLPLLEVLSYSVGIVQSLGAAGKRGGLRVRKLPSLLKHDAFARQR